MSTPHGFIEKLAELSQSGKPFVSVTMVDAVGSTPQDAGTKMLVDASGLVFGTVGGGRVEKQAIEFAQRMLNERDSPTQRLVEWNLQRDVGMTCGGVVKLYFEAYNHRAWRIVVFGAGHVAQSLVRCLVELECQVVCIDPRSDAGGSHVESTGGFHHAAERWQVVAIHRLQRASDLSAVVERQ